MSGAIRRVAEASPKDRGTLAAVVGPRRPGQPEARA